MKFLLAYLLIGEAFGLAALLWAWRYNARFVERPVNGNWRDLVWVAFIQVTWPISVPVLTFVFDNIWRRAVQNEICVCGHTRNQHADAEDWAGKYTSCLYRAVSARWLVNAEGPEHVRCQCPKFTLPNVRPRR